jgi:hypothetical protein
MSSAASPENLIIDRPTALGDHARTAADIRDRILSNQRRDHGFFLTMAILSAALVFAGYAQTYYLKPFGYTSPQLSTLIHIHAAVFTAYLAFYVLQTALVSGGRRVLHMTLGWASVVFIPVMATLGTAAVFWGAKLGHKLQWPDVETTVAFNLPDVWVFTILATAGVLLRKRPETHRRLMLMALVGGLVPAAISRIQAVRHTPLGIGGAVVAFILVGPLYDLVTRRRIHPAYVWSFLFQVTIMPPTRLAIAHTATWHHFVDWVIG